MRTLGTAMMLVGIMVLIIDLLFSAVSGAFTSPTAEELLGFTFYLGVALCVAGALIFTLRVILARSRKH